MSNFLESLNSHLHQLMESDDRIYLLGEDILDPYGSAFKVFKGLSTKYPSRVFTTPISEAGFVGVGAGMALRGLRPIIEIMFGDFLTLAADQIINSLTKFNWMYNDQVHVPMVIRTPMGGRRGYGATHSQTLEKHFLGVSGLLVMAPCLFGSPGKLLTDVTTKTDRPVLFIENKSLYSMNLLSQADLTDMKIETITNNQYPTYKLSFKNSPAPNLTITAYGYMAELARQAALELVYEHELFTEIIIPTQLAPFELNTLIKSCRNTKNLLTVEEGGLTLGWGAEVITRVKEALNADLTSAKRVAALDSPIPAAIDQELQVLPNLADIVQTALKMV